MAKGIAEKIDILMKLTNTHNTALGRALNFDASYISRIRSGKRGLPPEQPFIKPASAYFAAHIIEDYQQNAVAEELGRPWPENVDEGAGLLAAWLEADPSEQGPVERMIAAMTGPIRRPELPRVELSSPAGSKTDASGYFGNAGKRDAVLAFLSALCKTGAAHTLLLHSDEGMEWLYEDAAFARAWAALLGKLAENGSKIKIIHSISRDGNEMWEAVRKWLPLYMSGAIEPYYYPRHRDGVYRRTLFVAVGHSALVASSVRGQTGEPLNVLFRDRASVLALEQEFNAYFSYCRPLMGTAYPDSLAELAPLVRAFLDAPGDPLAAFPGDVAICLKESAGALIVKTAPPYAAFSLREPRMVAAIEEYLRTLPRAVSEDKEQTIRRLEEYIKE